MFDYLHLSKEKSEFSIASESPSHKKKRVIEGNESLFLEIEIGRWIGKGLNMVWESINKKTNEIGALKEIPLKEIDHIGFKSEIEILEKIQKNPHPNLIDYKGYFITSQESKEGSIKYGYILMEKGTTSLANYIKIRNDDGNYFSDEDVLKFTRSMISGFVHLEKMQIAHRDIKPENVILFGSEDFEFKICDVGVSTTIGEGSNTTTYRTLMGTVAFLSPELLNAYKAQQILTQYNPYKSDVYSLGLVLIYFTTFKTISGVDRIDKDHKFLEGKIKNLIRDAKFRYKRIGKLSKILKKMLTENFEDRPNFIGLEEYLNEIKFYQFTSDNISEKKEDCLTDYEELKTIDDITKKLPLILKKKPYFLKIDYSNRPLNADNFSFLFNEIEKCMFLRKFDLNLELNNLNAKLSLPIEIGLLGLDLIEEIYLSFWNNRLEDNGVKEILQGLKNMKKLRILEADFSVNYISDACLINLESITVNLCSLISLKLDFGKNQIINEKGIKSLNEGLLKILTLEELQLNFERYNGVKNLLNDLEKLTNLSSIFLNLSGNEIIDTGLFEISDFIDKKKNLKVFHLISWNNKIKDKSFRELCKSLSKHTELDSLGLVFYDNNISNEKQYIGSMLKMLTGLKELDLNFSSNKITDSGLIDIAQGLFELTNIRKLKLFIENLSISNESIRYLGKSLTKSKSLTWLNISLKGNNGLDFNSLEMIANGLNEMRLITTLNINLEGINMSNAGLKILSTLISQFPLLTTSIFNCAECGVSNNGVDLLLKTLSELDNLIEVYIDLRRNNINQSLAEDLRKKVAINFLYRNNSSFEIKL